MAQISAIQNFANVPDLKNRQMVTFSLNHTREQITKQAVYSIWHQFITGLYLKKHTRLNPHIVPAYWMSIIVWHISMKDFWIFIKYQWQEITVPLPHGK